LKEKYKKHLQTLGATGAGLAPDDITPDSEMANLVGKPLSQFSLCQALNISNTTASIVSEWPWWKDFHSFWRELPNYNLIAVTTSTPGVDHASQAAAIFESTGHGDVDDTLTAAEGETAGIFGEELSSDGENEAEEQKEKSLTNYLWFVGLIFAVSYGLILSYSAVLFPSSSCFLGARHIKASPSEHNHQVVG
jgi:hypothetical protein